MMQTGPLSFYSFFTKYSLMDEYGFSSGLISRLFRKVLPPFPEENTVEYILLTKELPIPYLLSLVGDDGEHTDQIVRQLDLSIKALCSKVVTFGLDNAIKARYKALGFDAQPFEALLDKVHKTEDQEKNQPQEVIESLKGVKQLIHELRQNRTKMGTNFHFTVTTRGILEYAERIEQLLRLKGNLYAQPLWENLFEDFAAHLKQKNSIRRFIGRHFDMVAIEIVDHTSQKGEKYVAENRQDYWRFFRRSLLGGGMISVFALFKLLFDSFQLTDVRSACLFSINYALCFILVKQAGGIIATKQPAMTASTIAEHIVAKRVSTSISIASITVLVRKVARSQFISVIGNFLMAILFACLIMLLLTGLEIDFLSKTVKPEYLMDKVQPTVKLVFYAALAGVFLALSGLISGFIDNKIVEGKIYHRIRHSSLFFRSARLAYFVEKNAGSLIGNIFLGFFLGSAFLVSSILHIPIDIRHIAFSSAQIGFSIVKEQMAIDIIFWAFFGALLIGLINFVVSFSITLYLALKSRRISLRFIPVIALGIAKDFVRNPMYYFIYRDDKNRDSQ